VTGALASAVKGLLFRSETAHPFEVVHWSDQFRELTPAVLLAAIGKPAATRVEEVTLAELFGNVSKAEPWQDEDVRREVPRYQNLIRTLEANLSGVRVFRVGTTEIDVYIVGRTAAGDWAGLRTLVVET
jgi:hypothetical protein